MNYLPFMFYRCLANERQWCRTHRLLGIAYLFALEMKSSSEALLREFMGKNSQTINRLEDTSVCNVLL